MPAADRSREAPVMALASCAPGLLVATGQLKLGGKEAWTEVVNGVRHHPPGRGTQIVPFPIAPEQLEVTVVTTERAKHFYNPQDVPVTLYSDADEWEMWKRRSDPVLHIDLRRWADLMLVAPLDANTLGKVASGICDNLLTCVIRAWDLSKPLLFCPAMNTAMWEHPLTARQVGQLKSFGYVEIPCVSKKLVCGDQATDELRFQVSAPWLRWRPLWIK
ncbi:phosphopantothenoylcysteine decarboxylase isoform X2 [Meriones unguiculatus]|uniref:phosphopantothenoylcysteine decarboxylase isoform X2 n=1 Tax=Meriones unguiculatus TaxID=10047 RepID=UPI00293EEB27|nr:phosphopantothenoylcysteine decarboxylase isoform X2 [Meriones unguiculatus]